MTRRIAIAALAATLASTAASADTLREALRRMEEEQQGSGK